MTRAPADAVQRLIRLQAAEAGLRESARIVELNPAMKPEADALFRKASDLRAERLDLARQCGLL